MGSRHSLILSYGRHLDEFTPPLCTMEPLVQNAKVQLSYTMLLRSSSGVTPYLSYAYTIPTFKYPLPLSTLTLITSLLVNLFTIDNFDHPHTSLSACKGRVEQALNRLVG